MAGTDDARFGKIRDFFRALREHNDAVRQENVRAVIKAYKVFAPIVSAVSATLTEILTENPKSSPTVSDEHDDQAHCHLVLSQLGLAIRQLSGDKRSFMRSGSNLTTTMTRALGNINLSTEDRDLLVDFANYMSRKQELEDEEKKESRSENLGFRQNYNWGSESAEEKANGDEMIGRLAATVEYINLTGTWDYSFNWMKRAASGKQRTLLDSTTRTLCFRKQRGTAHTMLEVISGLNSEEHLELTDEAEELMPIVERFTYPGEGVASPGSRKLRYMKFKLNTRDLLVETCFALYFLTDGATDDQVIETALFGIVSGLVKNVALCKPFVERKMNEMSHNTELLFEATQKGGKRTKMDGGMVWDDRTASTLLFNCFGESDKAYFPRDEGSLIAFLDLLQLDSYRRIVYTAASAEQNFNAGKETTAESSVMRVLQQAGVMANVDYTRGDFWAGWLRGANQKSSSVSFTVKEWDGLAMFKSMLTDKNVMNCIQKLEAADTFTVNSCWREPADNQPSRYVAVASTSSPKPPEERRYWTVLENGKVTSLVVPPLSQDISAETLREAGLANSEIGGREINSSSIVINSLFFKKGQYWTETHLRDYFNMSKEERDGIRSQMDSREAKMKKARDDNEKEMMAAYKEKEGGEGGGMATETTTMGGMTTVKSYKVAPSTAAVWGGTATTSTLFPVLNPKSSGTEKTGEEKVGEKSEEVESDTPPPKVEVPPPSAEVQSNSLFDLGVKVAYEKLSATLIGKEDCTPDAIMSILTNYYDYKECSMTPEIIGIVSVPDHFVMKPGDPIIDDFMKVISKEQFIRVAWQMNVQAKVDKFPALRLSNTGSGNGLVAMIGDNSAPVRGTLQAKLIDFQRCTKANQDWFLKLGVWPIISDNRYQMLGYSGGSQILAAMKEHGAAIGEFYLLMCHIIKNLKSEQISALALPTCTVSKKKLLDDCAKARKQDAPSLVGSPYKATRVACKAVLKCMAFISVPIEKMPDENQESFDDRTARKTYPLTTEAKK